MKYNLHARYGFKCSQPRKYENYVSIIVLSNCCEVWGNAYIMVILNVCIQNKVFEISLRELTISMFQYLVVLTSKPYIILYKSYFLAYTAFFYVLPSNLQFVTVICTPSVLWIIS